MLKHLAPNDNVEFFRQRRLRDISKNHVVPLLLEVLNFTVEDIDAETARRMSFQVAM